MFVERCLSFILPPFLKGDVLKMDRECHLFLNQFSIAEAIKPNNWGPQCWGFLDHVAFSFPIAPNATEQQHVYDYFHSLKNVLPCVTCKNDFAKMLEEDPIDRHLHCREALVLWLLDKHNKVNIKLGKNPSTQLRCI